MKVLFVSSGKSGGVSEVIRNQGESLKETGIILDYFIIRSGFWNYFKSIFLIRYKCKRVNYNLVHAHYSFSGFAASFAGEFPLVVSLMGSDIYRYSFYRKIAKLFARLRWDATIVKNIHQKSISGISNAHKIPNGVNLERFKPISRKAARAMLKLPEDKLIIVSVTYKNRPEKNIDLAKKAIDLLKDNNVQFLHVSDVPNELVPYYLNSADLLLLTSKWEGSPNIIKEAMACNCPIVSTDVGDVSWLFSGLEGCYLTSFDPNEISLQIREALDFGKRTNGRQRIIDLGLDSVSVAENIRDLYKKVLAARNKV